MFGKKVPVPINVAMLNKSPHRFVSVVSKHFELIDKVATAKGLAPDKFRAVVIGYAAQSDMVHATDWSADAIAYFPGAAKEAQREFLAWMLALAAYLAALINGPSEEHAAKLEGIWHALEPPYE